MFAGLVLTSISTVMMRAALFQRKSRSGWLEELDGIREDALDEPGSGADVVDAAGIWTDLRDGGEYEDPHEISSLYATDDTPDLPVTTRPSAKAAPRSGRSKATAADAPAAPPSATNGSLLPPPPPPVAETPPSRPPAPVEVTPPQHDAPAEVPAASHEVAPAPNGQYDDQIWVQPSPHPIRPSEMWHPAELAPVPLGDESFAPVAEERVASADLMDPTYRPGLGPVDDGVRDDQIVARLESELASTVDAPAAQSAVVNGGLVNGPVGRRVRRDRPVERPKASLPPPAAQSPRTERGEQSPLPTQPLPPAALPTRSNRLPELETLPATPSSVVPPRPAAGPAPLPASAAVAPEAPVPTVAATPPPAEPDPAPPAPAPITIGADGLIDAPGTIVRIGGERRARAVGGPQGVVVVIEEGWCWASPGEGAAAALRIDLPNGSLVVEPGATALAVVEADRSVFLIVAAGSAYLSRGDDGATVDRGTIVMIDPSGNGQTDAATDAEIEADPIVAENLVLDAEL